MSSICMQAEMNKPEAGVGGAVLMRLEDVRRDTLEVLRDIVNA